MVLPESADLPQALNARLLTIPERHPTAVIVLLGLLFATAYASSLVLRPKPDGRILIGDALHHYVQLRSAVFDRDLHFRNEYVRMYRLEGNEPGTEWVYEPTPTGHVRNLMPVGPALLWTPLFLLVTATLGVANALGANHAFDGYGRLFQATAGLTGVAAAAVGAWITWKTAALLFTARVAIWSCLTIWLASSTIYYSLVSPTYSHAASFLVSAAFWLMWVRMPEGTTLQRRYVILGTLAGLAALMRWQDAILLVSIAAELALRIRRRQLTFFEAASRGALAVVCAAIAFLPQMIVWSVLYGRPLALPQGPAFMRWTEPALINVLLSDNHGLFSWTPIVLVAVLGVPLIARRDRNLAIGLGVFLLLSWYVNAAVVDWWAGEAFGARRFVSCAPVFVLGLAAVIDRWSPSLRALASGATVFIVHTGLLLVQYQLFMHGWRDLAPYPAGAYGLGIARFAVPLDLLREWLRQ
jgi:hypothetical protein